MLTLFCKRMLLVHFFSSIVSYLLIVVGSKFSSSFSVDVVWVKPFAVKYARIDLFLGNGCQKRTTATVREINTYSSPA